MIDFNVVNIADWTPSPGYLARLELAAALKVAATKLDAPPQYVARNRIHCRGERLSKLLWRGRQWAVTSYGIECRDGTYAIAKDRLWENDKKYGWVRHMTGKAWVDLPDFAEALRIARRIASGSTLDREKVVERERVVGVAEVTEVAEGI